MYQILSDPEYERIQVFAKTSEAKAWLNAQLIHLKLDCTIPCKGDPKTAHQILEDGSLPSAEGQPIFVVQRDPRTPGAKILPRVVHHGRAEQSVDNNGVDAMKSRLP